MKKLIGFLIVAALAACTCLSQIPDQLLYVDQNCEGILPDYSPDVIVSDNCSATTLTQDPVPGTILTYANRITTVTMTVLDEEGNDASMIFRTVLVDTTPPTIEPGPGLLSYNEEYFGRIVQRMHQGVVNMHDSLLVMYPETNQDTSHRHDNLLLVSQLGAKYMPMQFVDPTWYLLGADSTFLADSCGLSWTTLTLEFIKP